MYEYRSYSVRLDVDAPIARSSLKPLSGTHPAHPIALQRGERRNPGA